ncbi:hypothetical protein VC83_04403 [Pseudogymnoascus destructans]|nr:uncharacterized protein VC83_04403 [Pseudogymnoascus destructans]OAF59079.2 hypothetical protein VC83_04403 [Pseudogymnoascus destructans]
MLLAPSVSQSYPRRQLLSTIATTTTSLVGHSNYTFGHQLLDYPSLSQSLFFGQLGSDSPSLDYATSEPEGFGSDDIWQQDQLMQSEQSGISTSWHFANGKLTPTSARSHQRESSQSSLGSAGPASPYNYNTSHPQVALPPDSAGGETYYEGLPVADQATYYNFSKTPSHTQDQYLPAVFQQNYNFHPCSTPTNYNSMMPMDKRAMMRDDETMSVPDYGHSGRPSVASTQGSPATPIGNGFDEPNRKTEYHNSNAIPKLDRTMSDAYNDELYSPNFTFTSAPPSQESRLLPSQSSDVFSQRLQAANSQHLSASTQQPLGNQSRRRSPFRQGSPLAPLPHRGFNSQSSTQQIRLGTAAHMREQQKAEDDARVLEEQIRESSPEQSTPKTISPKDALLEYHGTEEDAAMPLFPQTQQYRFPKPTSQESQELDDTSSQQSFASMVTSRRPSSSAYSNSSQATPRNRSFAFAPPSVPGATQMPQQQYQFVLQQRQAQNLADRSSQLVVALPSVESSNGEYATDASELKKPARSNADSGTYTCTYHGCTLRFETPAKLQKHKREGHRQSAPLISGVTTSARRASSDGGGSGMTSAALLRNSQAGPHKCERINPSTGKPCNAIFSRPYDLTRHEDTIHNARKQKVHCQFCTEEKTFSRNDALTRHMRVVHPEIDFPGKTRRRV